VAPSWWSRRQALAASLRLQERVATTARYDVILFRFDERSLAYWRGWPGDELLQAVHQLAEELNVFDPHLALSG
jgi:hypothetical protein